MKVPLTNEPNAIQLASAVLKGSGDDVIEVLSNFSEKQREDLRSIVKLPLHRWPGFEWTPEDSMQAKRNRLHELSTLCLIRQDDLLEYRCRNCSQMRVTVNKNDIISLGRGRDHRID